jgi:O-antigen/teichoic acid export membrane protein
VGVQLAKSLVEIGLKLWMLFGLEWGVKGFLLSILIGEALGTTTVTLWVLSRTGVRVVWRVLAPMVRYTLPLVPVGLCQLGLHQIDRLLLKYMGPDDLLVVGQAGTVADSWVGVYGLGYKIAFLLHTAVLTSFMQIWQPWVFGLKAGEERSKEIVRIGTWAMTVLASVYVGVILFGRQAVDVLAGQEGYREAWRVAPLVALAYLFYGAYSISQVTLFVAKRTWPLLWINLSCLGVNVSANLLLIPRLGTVGAALSTVVTFALLAVLGAWASRREGHLPFEPLRVLLLSFVAAGCAGLVWSLDAWRDPLTSWGVFATIVGAKAVLGALVLAVLWFGVLDGDGRSGLKRLLRDLRSRFA